MNNRMSSPQGAAAKFNVWLVCLLMGFADAFVSNAELSGLKTRTTGLVNNFSGESPLSQSRCKDRSVLLRSKYGDESERFDADVLNRRIQNLRLEIREDERQQPPHPNLSSKEFVTRVLDGLLHPYDPLPEYGFRTLLRSSTKRWRNKIRESIGAPQGANTEMVISALGEAIGRPNNQFAILVGNEEEYYPSFQFDPVDYLDGDCWIECRLRGKKDDSLLAITGWQLRQRADGAWLVDGIEWQDFRDNYRPGIGREEWTRICK